MKCIECPDGEFVTVLTTIKQGIEVDGIKTIIHIPNIKASVCNSCGNTLLSPKSCQHLEKEIKKKKYHMSEQNRRKQIREYLDDESV